MCLCFLTLAASIANWLPLSQTVPSAQDFACAAAKSNSLAYLDLSATNMEDCGVRDCLTLMPASQSLTALEVEVRV